MTSAKEEQLRTAENGNTEAQIQENGGETALGTAKTESRTAAFCARNPDEFEFCKKVRKGGEKVEPCRWPLCLVFSCNEHPNMIGSPCDSVEVYEASIVAIDTKMHLVQVGSFWQARYAAPMHFLCLHTQFSEAAFDLWTSMRDILPAGI